MIVRVLIPLRGIHVHCGVIQRCILTCRSLNDEYQHALLDLLDEERCPESVQYIDV